MGSQNLTAETLLPFLISFIAKRVCTVRWEFPHPNNPISHQDTYQLQKAVFIKLLKSTYPTQVVGKQLKRIILDENVWFPFIFDP